MAKERPWNKLIVALDLVSEQKIKAVLDALSPKVNKFKVGLIAYSKFGPQVIKWVKDKDAQIFLDFKLYDIPSTMKKTAALITELGCWAFTVHLKAGEAALREVRGEVGRTARKFKIRRPLILGVTELTSEKATLKKVLALASIASRAGLEGVIASSKESEKIKKHYRLKVITPGIRAPKCAKGGQKRVSTAQFALSQGADYIVVGRPIVEGKDYSKAAEGILGA